jgi:chromosome segregation ATPase
MAGANYVAHVEARIVAEKAKLQAQINTQTSGGIYLAVTPRIATNQDALIRQAQQLAMRLGAELSKVKVTWKMDEQGIQQITGAVAQFKNAATGLTSYEQFKVPTAPGVKFGANATTGSYNVDYLASLKKIQALDEQIAGIETRRVDLNEKLLVSAQGFLAKTEGATGAKTAEARQIAQQITDLGQARAALVQQFGAQSPQVKQLDTDMGALSNKFKIAQEGIKGTATAVRSWSDSMVASIKQTVVYSLSVGALYSAISQLKEGIAYIAELNKQMTSIQVLQVQGASTNSEIAKLAGSFNLLAKEMGVTTSEVAKGSVNQIAEICGNA